MKLIQLTEAIQLSTSYKIVRKEDNVIISQGSKKQMLIALKKLNKDAPGKYYLGNSPGKTIGDVFK